MYLRTAERQGALAAVDLVLLQGVGGALLGRHMLREDFLIETAPPRDIAVVNLVRDAEIVKWTQQTVLDALRQVSAINEIFAAECQEVTPVGALGCGGQPQQKPRLEVVDQLPIAPGRSVVKFINHNVVEILRAKGTQMFHAPDSLNGREKDVGLRNLFSSIVKSKICQWANPPEGFEGLLEDFLAMGNK